jgi:hypothetical protein
MAQSAEVVNKQSDPRLGWPRPPLAPRWMIWVPQAAILWALVYGFVRVRWAIAGAPSFGPQHIDLMYLNSWTAVALCAAAALVALALRIAPWHWPLLVAACAVCAAHLVACPLLLLDVVSVLLPGLGLPFSAAGFFSRSGCLIQGVLVGASAVAFRRRSDCLFCGRSGVTVHPEKSSRWALWAAYAAVIGCLIRLAAQYLLAFGDLARHVSGTRLVVEALIFEAGFLLAGVILPLALVHRWGRRFPAWIPALAGRAVPRWLLLGPAFVLSPLMTCYFTITLVKIATDALRGTSAQTFGSFPPAFFWVAVPGYLIWGVGLGIAAIGYQRMTRPRPTSFPDESF